MKSFKGDEVLEEGFETLYGMNVPEALRSFSQDIDPEVTKIELTVNYVQPIYIKDEKED